MVPFAKPLIKLTGLESIAAYSKQRSRQDRAYKNMCLSHDPHSCPHIRNHTGPRFDRGLRLIPRDRSMEGVIIDCPAREPPWQLRFPGTRRHFEEYGHSLDDYGPFCRQDRRLGLISPPPRRRRRLHPELRPRHRVRGGDLEDYSEFSGSDYEFDYMTDGETNFEISSATNPGSYVRRRPRPRFHNDVWDNPHHGHPVHARHNNDYDYNHYAGWEDDTNHGREMDHTYRYSARHGSRAGRRDSYLVDPHETDIEDDLETL